MSVSIRYAKALFQLGGEQNKIDQFMRELGGIKQLFDQSAELKSLFEDRLTDRTKKIGIISNLYDKLSISKEVTNLVVLLINGGREPILDDIIRRYEELYNDYKGLIPAEVCAAYDMAPEDMDALKARIKDLFNKDPLLTATKDGSIIGGLRLRVGWTVYDGTIKTHLKDFTKAIKI